MFLYPVHAIVAAAPDHTVKGDRGTGLHLEIGVSAGPAVKEVPVGHREFTAVADNQLVLAGLGGGGVAYGRRHAFNAVVRGSDRELGAVTQLNASGLIVRPGTGSKTFNRD